MVFLTTRYNYCWVLKRNAQYSSWGRVSIFFAQKQFWGAFCLVFKVSGIFEALIKSIECLLKQSKPRERTRRICVLFHRWLFHSRHKHVLTFKSATLRTAHLPYLLPTVALVKDCPACIKIVFVAARTCLAENNYSIAYRRRLCAHHRKYQVLYSAIFFPLRHEKYSTATAILFVEK